MLKLEDLSVAVNDRPILHDVNLHIKPGEVHVLFGPNGTGKSTLIGAIMGFARYTIIAGRIYFKGQDITNLPVDERARLGLGIMIQRPPTLRGLTVREMVQICGNNQVDVDKLAGKTNMCTFLARGVNEGFSGGELKRSELLQLLAQQPDLVMLDEPESGVDIENIVVVGQAANSILERDLRKNGQTIKKYRTERQKSGLIITHTGHILDYVPADMAHVMYQGTVACSGNPMEMLSCIQEKGYEECVNCAV
ncbi:ABC transporter ATP-binding protein [Sporomusa sphaeroides]|uniref:ABC transporter ATP-binding protein n=1 Tax=Sporomusa sphaeroides TaxID=47679 RepID=UPI002B5D3D0A|nr:ABC transporter ATP-binding protein [Sporomusa sphaeroides]HML34909.1 ABC transporter ATP-binding protein [Sporomusa sphaeroides]